MGSVSAVPGPATQRGSPRLQDEDLGAGDHYCHQAPSQKPALWVAAGRGGLPTDRAPWIASGYRQHCSGASVCRAHSKASAEIQTTLALHISKKMLSPRSSQPLLNLGHSQLPMTFPDGLGHSPCLQLTTATGTGPLAKCELGLQPDFPSGQVDCFKHAA